MSHAECDVAVLQQDGHLWRDDGSGEVLRIVDLFAKGARTIEVRDSPLAIGQADAVEELVGSGRHVGVRCTIDSYNILLVFFDLHGYARKPIKIYFTLPYLSVAVYQEPLVQVLDIPNELPEHRANGLKSRSLLEPDDGEVATYMLKWLSMVNLEIRVSTY